MLLFVLLCHERLMDIQLPLDRNRRKTVSGLCSAVVDTALKVRPGRRHRLGFAGQSIRCFVDKLFRAPQTRGKVLDFLAAELVCALDIASLSCRAASRRAPRPGIRPRRPDAGRPRGRSPGGA